MGPDDLASLQALIDESSVRATPFTRKIMPRAMTAEEVRSLMNGRKGTVIVATVRKDGSPHTAYTPVACVGGSMYTYADPRSVCYRNLRRDGRLSAAVIGGSGFVFVEGRAAEVGRVCDLVDTLVARIFEASDAWIPKTSVMYPSLKECRASVFEVTPTRVITCKARGA